jgi:hypothetical protein
MESQLASNSQSTSMAAQEAMSRPKRAQESRTAVIRNATPAKRESLFGIRFCSDGETFDLERIFLGGALSVKEKRKSLFI